VHEVPSSTIEAEIARLDAGIRQLKIQYDMFFNGALPREPFELRREIDRLIRRTSSLAIRKSAHRYHFNSLVSRFNALTEWCTKTMRAREEGERLPGRRSGRDSTRGERLLDSCRIGDPESDREHLRRLHRTYLTTREKSNPGSGAGPSFDAFVRGITAQADRLRQRTGCARVELLLMADGDAVRLKARPVKP